PGMGPLSKQCSTSTMKYEAIPKYMSERTSYLQVRLEFHPYPQLIRSFFNISRFGPPSSVTWTSTWSWVDHLVSGLHTHTTRPFQTRFRSEEHTSALQSRFDIIFSLR